MRYKNGLLLFLCFVALLQTGCNKEAVSVSDQALSSAEAVYFGAEYEEETPEPSAISQLSTISVFDAPDNAGEDTEEPPVPLAQERITLEGKRILFFGDSLFSGRDETDAPWTWANRFDETCGTSSTIIARHGATIAASYFPFFYIPGGSFDPMVIRPLPEMDFDVVFLTGGFNDWKCEIPLSGDTNSTDPLVFEGAVNVLIDRCRDAYPNARILFFIPWVTGSGDNYSGNSSLDYIRTIKEICEKKGISYYPAYDPTISGIDVSSESFVSEHFNGDTWHLNEAGHSMILERIIPWTEECLNEDAEP